MLWNVWPIKAGSRVVPPRKSTASGKVDCQPKCSPTDVQPTRLDAARTAAKTFLDQVPEKFQVGVVSFATRAAVAVAPTQDRALVTAALDTLKPGEGTAIGDAVALSLRVGQPPGQAPANAPPRAVVLISDGAQDGGRVKPTEAAQQAKKQGVPVYTVLVGTEDGVVEEQLPGGLKRIIHVPPSPETLQQVAQDSGGQFFTALDSAELSKVYEGLGSRLGSRNEDGEITDVFAALAAGLLLISGVTSAFLLRGVW